MKLLEGCQLEYKRRHDTIWPELKDLLHAAGISQYSIFLDESNLDLFGFLHLKEGLGYEALPTRELMRKWWEYMADIMETNPDHSPLSLALKEVFYME